ncbi:MAG: ABC transporter permease, partial [Chlorobiota bacterium]
IMTNITPTKFFNTIMRAIILRGTGIETFWTQIINLLIFTSVMVLLSMVVSKAKERKA